MSSAAALSTKYSVSYAPFYIKFGAQDVAELCAPTWPSLVHQFGRALCTNSAKLGAPIRLYCALTRPSFVH